MGRTRAWDEPQVLATAFRLFRQRGYRLVSMRDLETACGLNPGSIYHQYGSKEGVFAAALQTYVDEVVDARVRVHLDEADDPIQGIHALFASTIPTEGDHDPGCLLTNTAIESYGLEPSAASAIDLAAAVVAGLARIEDGLARAVERAQGSGRLRRPVDPRAIAGQLLVLYQGLLVMVRLGRSPTALDATTRSAIDAILAPALSPERQEGDS